MVERSPRDVGTLDVSIAFGESDPSVNYVWVPDALEIVVSDSSSMSKRLSYTCLEHLFVLLDQITRRESGRVLAGTGHLDVTVTNAEIVVAGGLTITGTVQQMEAVVRALIRDVFEKLRDEGFDTRRVAKEDISERFSLTIDPLRVHDSLMGTAG